MVNGAQQHGRQVPLGHGVRGAQRQAQKSSDGQLAVLGEEVTAVRPDPLERADRGPRARHVADVRDRGDLSQRPLI